MDEFDYNIQTKMYTVATKNLTYTMPFVSTLRFKRFMQSVDWTSDETLIHNWYDALDEREKLLITCKPVKDQLLQKDQSSTANM